MFSHIYPKLHRQTTAVLTRIDQIDAKDLAPAFVEYDTVFEIEPQVYDHYLLPSGLVLVLTFIGNLRIPFTTVRRSHVTKQEYYLRCIGKVFEVVIEPEPKPESIPEKLDI